MPNSDRDASPGAPRINAAYLTNLRRLGVAEGVSTLVLFFIAMPLKYGADMPQAVTVVGMVHGVVWMLLMWQLMRARFETAWPSSRLWLLGIAALLPIVPFFLDRRVRDWIARG